MTDYAACKTCIIRKLLAHTWLFQLVSDFDVHPKDMLIQGSLGRLSGCTCILHVYTMTPTLPVSGSHAHQNGHLKLWAIKPRDQIVFLLTRPDVDC
jgi:hypothetical protein